MFHQWNDRFSFRGSRRFEETDDWYRSKGAIDRTHTNRYMPIKGLPPVICISGGKVKEGRGETEEAERDSIDIAGIICPWINIPSMAQRRRRFGGSLFWQTAKSAYYFTPRPGTGYVLPWRGLATRELSARSQVRARVWEKRSYSARACKGSVE